MHVRVASSSLSWNHQSFAAEIVVWATSVVVHLNLAREERLYSFPILAFLYNLHVALETRVATSGKCWCDCARDRRVYIGTERNDSFDEPFSDVLHAVHEVDRPHSQNHPL